MPIFAKDVHGKIPNMLVIEKSDADFIKEVARTMGKISAIKVLSLIVSDRNKGQVTSLKDAKDFVESLEVSFPNSAR